MTNAITVKNLTKKYDDFTAVNGISFEVEEGELFAFLGENGAGKSTTINILCTILNKTAGEVSVFGHELSSDDVEKLCEVLRALKPDDKRSLLRT